MGASGPDSSPGVVSGDGRLRLPQEVPPTLLGLEADGGQRSGRRGGQEVVDSRVCGRPARVGRRPQPEIPPFEAIGLDAGAQPGTGGDDDTPARHRRGPGQDRERVVVGDVIRADDEDGHSSAGSGR